MRVATSETINSVWLEQGGLISWDLDKQVPKSPGWFVLRFAIDASEFQVDLHNQPSRLAHQVNLQIGWGDEWYRATLLSYYVTDGHGLVWYDVPPMQPPKMQGAERWSPKVLSKVNDRLVHNIQEFEAMILPAVMQSLCGTVDRTGEK